MKEDRSIQEVVGVKDSETWRWFVPRWSLEVYAFIHEDAKRKKTKDRMLRGLSKWL